MSIQSDQELDFGIDFEEVFEEEVEETSFLIEHIQEKAQSLEDIGLLSSFILREVGQNLLKLPVIQESYQPIKRETYEKLYENQAHRPLKEDFKMEKEILRAVQNDSKKDFYLKNKVEIDNFATIFDKCIIVRNDLDDAKVSELNFKAAQSVYSRYFLDVDLEKNANSSIF